MTPPCDLRIIERQKHWAAEYLRRLQGDKVKDYRFVYAFREASNKKKTLTIWHHLMCFEFRGTLSPAALGLKLAKEDLIRQNMIEFNKATGGKVLLS